MPKVATLDWTVAETLLGLGVSPVAVGDKQSYQNWVSEPALPQSVVDLGTRLQPNKELLAQLEIEHFPNGDMYFATAQANLPYLSPVKAVERMNFYQAGDFWQNQLNATRQLAQNVGVDPQPLISKTETIFAAHKAQLAPFQPHPLLIVQFIDARHLRVYGEQSLPGAVLSHLGLQNAWQQAVNLWGFSQISLNQLAQFPNAKLVVIKPYPQNVPTELANNSLWKQLPLAKDPLILPAIWTFGALPSAQRLAVALSQGLQNAHKQGEAQW
ncbi:iron ABC transporter substrate-binding protein [Avibacterium paragallinarum]|uniref:Iron ABC transporter substrate-binding protein n=2 Tax=Avibacterium paragallinarum TaxID=728 RepID=A0AAE5TJS2_AVIPA|nr:iron ABC transporter substrate-binding protein [Avibacterium paragallinarum]PXZ42620.1 iron ABC transporter substrate-binding protein [Avibacterium paragallinarum]